jgi:hypothetical protein
MVARDMDGRLYHMVREANDLDATVSVTEGHTPLRRARVALDALDHLLAITRTAAEQPSEPTQRNRPTPSR